MGRVAEESLLSSVLILKSRFGEEAPGREDKDMNAGTG